MEPGDVEVIHERRSVRGHEVSLGYAGPAVGITYVQRFVRDRLFGDSNPAGPAQSTGWQGSLHDAVESLGADLTIVVGTQDQLRDVNAAKALEMPSRVHMVADLAPGAPAATDATFKLQLRRHRARIRRYAHDWEIASADEDYHWFYDHMYTPTMKRRHGARARTVDRETGYETLFRAGNLLFVTVGGQRIAGVVSQAEPQRSLWNVRLGGWLHGADEYLRQEALKSAYFFLRERGAESRVRWLDFQGCEPFLSKGTFQSKRRLGTTVTHAPGDMAPLRMRVIVRRDLPAIRDFLVANPPMRLDGSDRISATYFFDDTRASRDELAWRTHGLCEARHIHLDTFLEPDRC